MANNSYSNEIISKNKEIKRIFRSPTLDTVRMVEKTIEKNNAQYTKRRIWEKLPRKVMWGTYIHILNYLEEINKIMIAEGGILVYIWNPKLAEKYIKKRGIKYVKTDQKKTH